MLLALAAILVPLLQAQSVPEGSQGLDGPTLWARLCAASGGTGREPVQAFALQAEVLTRASAQTNQMRIDFTFLAPDCVRFMLPSKNETGRFGSRPEDYWLRSGTEVVVLAGREYKEDRRKVDDMLTLARNYVALSNPSRLRMSAQSGAQMPPDLGTELAKRSKKLRWIAFDSPDFALVQAGDEDTGAPRNYHVELGLREDFLPGIAIVREAEKGRLDPLLVEFSKFEERDGFKIPFVLLVHAFDRTQSPPVFQASPTQEVYLVSAALRPALKVDDFKPQRER
jgi:hypothetical protein